MKPRSRQILLKNGHQLTTPLLVPSLSSKGFPTLGGKDAGKSESGVYLGIVGPSLNESLLISAYDVHYRLLAGIEKLTNSFFDSVFANPKMLVLDSGGYERGRDYDSGAVYRFTTNPKPWGPGLLNKTLASLSPQITGVLVNLDKRDSYKSQIAAAQAYFTRWPRFLADVLLKPEPKQKYLSVEGLRPHMRRLLAFDIVGVTEKELGPSVLERVVALARLRQALDDRGVDRPIHVFGSLDTLFTPLYFFAGAEIFDGLTWLRYAYHKGATLYADALALLEGNLTLREEQRAARVLVQNIDYLAKLNLQMKRYLVEGEMSVFGEFGAETLLAARSAAESILQTENT